MIENVTCKKADRYGIYAVGKAGAPIQDILIRNVNVEWAKIPQLLSIIKSVRLENVRVNGVELQPEPVDAKTLKARTDV